VQSTRSAYSYAGHERMAALTLALTEPWSNGQADGQDSRLKLT
jgi:hypothetical protein